MTGPEATKRALLDAGRAEFARHGLAGARTDRIAAHAGVNKQRIYAYFGNKEGMFHAVLADALDSLLGVVPYPEGDLTPPQFLSAYVQAVSDYHAQHPDLLRLLQWEALELGASERATDSRSGYYRDKVASFAEHLRLDPEEAAPLLFGVIGLAAWPHVVPQLAALILDKEADQSQEAAMDWACRHVRALAGPDL